MKKIYSLISNRKVFSLGIAVLLMATGVNVYIPLVVKDLFNKFADNQNFISSVYVLAILLMFNVLILTSGNAIPGVVGEKSVLFFRESLVRGVESLKVKTAQNYDTVEIANHITNDSEILGKITSDTLPSIITSTASWGASIAMLFFIDWRMTILILIVALSIGLVIKIIGAKMSVVAKAFRNQLANLTSKIAHSIQSRLDIKINDAEEWFSKKVENDNKVLYQTSITGIKYRVTLLPIINGILMALLVPVAGIGLYEIKVGILTVGSLISFVMYLYQLITPTLTLSSAIGDFATEQGSLNKVLELRQEFKDNEESNKDTLVLDDTSVINVKGVSVKYEQTTILKDVTFDLERGKVSVLVGPSGIGKTSLIKALLKVNEVAKGAILIGNINIKDVSVQELYCHIGYVGQFPFIVEGVSVADNLRLGHDEITDLDMEKALNDVGLLSELQEKGGLDYVIETRESLSGGQLQRLAIARALISAQDILILDEVTSALDETNEKVILELIDSLKNDYLIVQISHRNQVIKLADSVVDIEKFRS